MDRFGCFFSSLTSQPTSSTTQPHKIPATNLRNAISPCVFLHGFCPVSNMLKETHAVDYVGQSCPEVGWYFKTCLFSLWILVVKSAVRIWICLDCFFHHSLHHQNQQHHTTAQNASKQLAQCNFHHVCSCMDSVLFSNMLKDTHTADYVGQSCPEVGWYGKTCWFSLWILVVKSAVRIWICLDCFFHHSLHHQHQQHHTTAQNTSKQLAQCNFHHVCSCMGSVLFSNMLKETHTVDYVGQSFQ